MSGKTKNPRQYAPRKIGEPFQEHTHLDLFKGWKDARTGKVSSHGETPVFVPLEELTEEQILELPREAFNDEEWASLEEEVKSEILESSVHVPLIDKTTGGALKRKVGRLFETVYRTRTDYEDDDWDLLSDQSKLDVIKRTKRADVPDADWRALDKDDRAAIIEEDEDAQERIEALVKLFVGPYEWAQEPDNDAYVRDMVGNDYFHQWLQENADHLVERDGIEGDVDTLVEEYEGLGWGRDEIARAIDKALQDESNYDQTVGSQDGFFVDNRTEDEISVHAPEVRKALVGMSEDEQEIAVDQINKETHGVYGAWERGGRGPRKLTVGQLTAEKYDFTANVAVEYYVAWDPNWDKISNALDDILDDLYPDGPQGEPGPDDEDAEKTKWPDQSERVAKKWPDGFFVLDLTPKEMVAEGDEMGFCIGQRKYGYISGVEKKQAKAFSLRTPSGRPKITLYAEYGRNSGSRQGAPGERFIREIPEVKGKGNRLPGWDAGKPGQGKIKQDEVAKIIDFISNTLNYPVSQVQNLEPALRELSFLLWEKDPWALKVAKTVPEGVFTGTFAPSPRPPKGLHARNPARDSNPPPACPAHGPCGGGFCSPRKVPPGG